jgi:hypothetical protein
VVCFFSCIVTYLLDHQSVPSNSCKREAQTPLLLTEEGIMKSCFLSLPYAGESIFGAVVELWHRIQIPGVHNLKDIYMAM